jgi:small-conductance mechanosensitive channel
MDTILKAAEQITQYLLIAILPVTVIAVTLIVGFIIRKIIFSQLARATNNKTKIGEVIVSSIKGPFIVWFLMLGIYLALGVSKLPPNIIQLAGKILLAMGILSVTMVLVNLSSSAIKAYSYKFESVLPITSLTQNITRVVVFAIGILIILNTLGISITPIIATLGVGGLAVALALQDTLGNTFAGFYIVMSRQIRVGDYIKLDSGEEGYVVDITWRATKIRTLPNNVILIPNERLTKAITTNYYMPTKEIGVPINIGVHYNSNLKKVEAVTCEVAAEVMREVQGGVPEFQPFVRFHTFGESSINFTVILRAKEFVDQYLIKHEFIKRLHERYAKEGITIPYPIRAINYEQEKANKADTR